MLRQAVVTTRERIGTSPLAATRETRPVFVTQGGWRWRWLSTTAHGTFAITRPLTRAVMVNATDPVSGLVSNSRPRGRGRQLGGILAHEFCHGLIRRHFGVIRAETFPRWKVEGYCDHIAGESTLTAAEATRLEAAGLDHPALLYFRGRERVARELAANGGSVDALFRDTALPSGR